METPAPIAKAIPNAMPLGATGRSGTGRWPATTFVAPKVTRKKMSARTAANALPTGSFGTAANGQRNQVITTSDALPSVFEWIYLIGDPIKRDHASKCDTNQP